jgi:hypothetical protein
VNNPVSNPVSAQTAALEYLAEHYPALAGSRLAVLRLEAGWLVQTTAPAAGALGTSDTLMLMVDRHGVVEEIGSVLPRQHAHRFLAGLDVNGAARRSA